MRLYGAGSGEQRTLKVYTEVEVQLRPLKMAQVEVKMKRQLKRTWSMKILKVQVTFHFKSLKFEMFSNRNCEYVIF